MLRNILAALVILLLVSAVAGAGEFYSIYNDQRHRWNPDSAADHQDTLLNLKKKINLFENAYLFIRVDGPSTMSTKFYLIFECYNAFLPNGPFTDTTSDAPLIYLRDSIVSDTVLHYLIHYAADTVFGQHFNFLIMVMDTLNEPDTIISIEEYIQTF